MEMWAAWLAPILAHVATSHWTLVKWWNLQFGYRVWHWLKLHIQRISWVTWVHFQRSDKIPRSSKGCTCSQAAIPDIPRLQQLLQVHGVVTATTQSSPRFQGCLQQWYFWLLFGNMCHGQKLVSILQWEIIYPRRRFPLWDAWPFSPIPCAVPCFYHGTYGMVPIG